MMPERKWPDSTAGCEAGHGPAPPAPRPSGSRWPSRVGYRSPVRCAAATGRGIRAPEPVVSLRPRRCSFWAGPVCSRLASTSRAAIRLWTDYPWEWRAMTPKTTFRIEPGASTRGMGARRVPEVDGPAGVFRARERAPTRPLNMRASDRPGAMRRRARTRWYCRTPQARPIRHALDHLDAERRFNRAATTAGATTRDPG